MQTDIQYLGCSIFILHMGGVYFGFSSYIHPIKFFYIGISKKAI